MLSDRYIVELYKNKFDELCSYAYIFTADYEVSRDIVQDVFVEFFEHMESYQEVLNTKAYLVRCVKNRCLNHIKSKVVKDKYFNAIVEKMALNTNDSVSDLELKEISERLHSSIEKLPEVRCKIFKMSREEGKTYSQIAEELNISIKTVEAHISKAIKFIKSNTDKVLFLLIVTFLLIASV
jgi:RNA polymerase sigma-70 factor, Bacteroides expansion family 1